MSGRSGMVGGGGGSLAPPGTPCDPTNQPMDLAQKAPPARSQEPGLVKGGGTTLVHYTTGGVAQILTSGTTAHVVPPKPVGRTESMGVGGQTVTLVSRSSAPTALNLASAGPGSGGPSVRTASHGPGQAVTVTSSAHLAYHIPRGAAAVANMAAPRTQTVATPMVRTVPQPLVQPSTSLPTPRSSVVGQRVVPVSTSGAGSGGTWARPAPSPAHTGKVSPAIHSSVTATSLSMGVGRGTMPATRPGQPGSITTYHAGGRATGVPGGPLRGAGGTTMRGMVAGEGGPRGVTPKAVHITQPIVQPQKYGGPMSGVMGGGGGGRSGGPAGGPGTSSATIYSPASPLVTTMAGPTVGSSASLRPQGPPSIAVRITTASIPTSATSSPVTSQAGNIGPIAMTSPSGGTPGTILTHHPSMQRTPQEHLVPLKTPIVRTPNTHQPSKPGVQGQTLAFSDGPKVITQPAQGPPLALTQISGLAGVGSQKPPVTHGSIQQQQQQHPTQVLHRGVVGASVGQVMRGAAIPVAKVPPQQASAQAQVTSAPRMPHVRAQSPGHAPDPQPAHTSVFLHRPHTGVSVTSAGEQRVVTTGPQYSITPQYYYEQGHNTYQVGVPHTLASTHYMPASMAAGGSLRMTPGPSSSSSSSSGGGGGGVASGLGGSQAEVIGPQGAVALPSLKPNASPRPSILRKRPDTDGTPLKASKNLTTALSMPSPPSPKRPDSRGNGNASSGSTTISANSSPGLQIEELDTGGPGGGSCSQTPPTIKQEPPDEATLVLPRPPPATTAAAAAVEPLSALATIPANTHTTLTVPQPHLSSPATPLHPPAQHHHHYPLPDGLSPRKKPRKQQLTGNELQEARSSEDDMDQAPLKKVKRDLNEDHNDLEGSEEDGEGWSEPGGGGSSGGSCGGGGAGAGVTTTVVITNRPTMSLLGSFRQTWKPRHNHFVRHTDVKPKDEKRLTVNEIANQKASLQRVNGWKIVHLSGQVDDLVELEAEVVDRLHLLLGSLEKRTHPRKPYKDFEKDVNRLSELVKANIQRSKIIRDQMVEARSQMHKLFDHKAKIVDIMTKYSSKRSVRKKEKS